KRPAKGFLSRLAMSSPPASARPLERAAGTRPRRWGADRISRPSAGTCAVALDVRASRAQRSPALSRKGSGEGDNMHDRRRRVLHALVVTCALAGALSVFVASSLASSSAVLADGPAGYWAFDEQPGATVAGDSTGHGHDGTYVNRPALRIPGPPGREGAALPPHR